ncbi:MAG: hypothetical protein AMJ68_08655 [Acidithiobacillales bacterium SG8_45]|jgi:hypothetical protein|nr:MAG: hypothetical protein AMJ68_08655 [Acidithiobacillales bacterium SG8_45]
MRTLPALIVLMFVVHPAFAANSAENKLVAFGFAAGKTCSTYVKQVVRDDRKDVITLSGKDYHSDRNMYTQWVAGFLSGYSAGIQKGYPEDLNVYYLMLKIETYCQNNPQALFSLAANKAIQELQ